MPLLMNYWFYTKNICIEKPDVYLLLLNLNTLDVLMVDFFQYIIVTNHY